MIIKIYSRRKELLKEQELLLRTLGLRILRPIHEAEQVQFLLGQVNFLICFLSHSGRYTLSSLNLVYQVLLFSYLGG